MSKSKGSFSAGSHKKEFPLFSIVILNWNGLEDTKICLEHVWKLDYPNFEVIVVDNGSRADSKEYLSKLKNIIYVDNPVNRGFTGGHIDGLKYCSGEFIVLLNNDAVMKADYLSTALTHFEDPNVAVVGGRSYWWDKDNTILDQSNRFYSYQEINIWTGEAIMNDYDYGVVQEVNNVSGSCVVVRRSTINELGYLYDRFFAYFEETDLFARVKRAGLKVLYDPHLQIWHKNGASSGSSGGSQFFYYQIFRNRCIFAIRNFEAKFLLRFLLNYIKLATKSAIKYTLRRGDQTMNRAYLHAAMYNVWHILINFSSRRELTKQLGNSDYNHQIYLEQTGVSVIIDATQKSQKWLDDQIKLSEINTLLYLYEYVFVVARTHKLPEPSSTLRFVVDAGIITANSLDFGCITSRFNWMVLADSAYQISSNLYSIPSRALGTKKSIGATVSDSGVIELVIMNKSFYERVGGIAKFATVSELFYYALLAHLLVNEKSELDLSSVTDSQIKHLQISCKLDKELFKSDKLSRYEQLRLHYYRFFQITTFGKWLFNISIPNRLKIARIKNFLLFTVTLNTQSLALEFKHIRNETLLYDNRHLNIKYQRQVIKDQLPKVQASDNDIPVFIICRDRVNDLKKLVSWLEKHKLTKIIFIDNDSSYPPLVEYLNHSPYQLLSLKRNVGHTSPWKLGIVRALAGESFYIVTDPDVIPDEKCPDDVLKHFIDIHSRHFEYQKVGFGLKIDDLPDHYPLKEHVVEWENQFWVNQIEEGAYEAGIDTTFALYKPFSYTYTLHPSIRTGEPYVARHLPWYHDPKNDTDEDIFYRFRADSGVNSWNSEELPERYKKEMKMQTKS